MFLSTASREVAMRKLLVAAGTVLLRCGTAFSAETAR
jgi:hypothetical protein